MSKLCYAAEMWGGPRLHYQVILIFAIRNVQNGYRSPQPEMEQTDTFVNAGLDGYKANTCFCLKQINFKNSP